MSNKSAETNKQTKHPKKLTSKRILRHLIELVVMGAVIWGIFTWQERHLLNNQESKPSPQIILPSLDGQSYQLADGQNKQLLYFFAPWCNICHLSIGNIEAQKEALSEKGIDVFYIALSWQDANEIKAFAKEHKLSFPVLLGTPKVMQEYKVQGFPTYYLLDEKGIAVSGSQGYSSEFGIWLRSF